MIRPTFSIAELLAETAVRLLRQHPERARVDAGAGGDELLERGVGLARVRRAEVRDDALRLGSRAGSEISIRRSACRTTVVGRRRCVALGAAGPLLRVRVVVVGASVSGTGRRVPEGLSTDLGAYNGRDEGP